MVMVAVVVMVVVCVVGIRRMRNTYRAHRACAIREGMHQATNLERYAATRKILPQLLRLGGTQPLLHEEDVGTCGEQALRKGREPLVGVKELHDAELARSGTAQHMEPAKHKAKTNTHRSYIAHRTSHSGNHKLTF